jgi:hypothetical protein
MINSLMFRYKQEKPASLVTFENNVNTLNPDYLNEESITENFHRLDNNVYNCEHIFLAGASNSDILSPNGFIYGFLYDGSIYSLPFNRASVAWGKKFSLNINSFNSNTIVLENFFYNQSAFGYIVEETYDYLYHATEVVYEDILYFQRYDVTLTTTIPTAYNVSWDDVCLIAPFDNTVTEHTLELYGITHYVGSTYTKRLMQFRYEEIGGYHMRLYINDVDNIYIDFDNSDLSYVKTDALNKIEKVEFKRYRDNIFITIIADDLYKPYMKLLDENNTVSFAGDINKGVKIGHFNVIEYNSQLDELKNNVYTFFTVPFTKNEDEILNIPITTDTIYFLKSAKQPLLLNTIIGTGNIDLNAILGNDKFYALGYTDVGKIYSAYSTLLTSSTYTYDLTVLRDSWEYIITQPVFNQLVLNRKGVLVLPFAYKDGFVAGIDMETLALIHIPFSRSHENVLNTCSIYENDLTYFSENEIMYTDALYDAHKCGYLIEYGHEVYDRYNDVINEDIFNPTVLQSTGNIAQHDIHMRVVLENKKDGESFTYSIINQRLIHTSSLDDRIGIENMNSGDTTYYGSLNSSDTFNRIIKTIPLSLGWYYVESQLFYSSDLLNDNDYMIDVNHAVDKLDGSDNVYGEYAMFNNRLVSNNDISQNNYSRKLIGENTNESYKIGHDYLNISAYTHIYVAGERNKFKHLVNSDMNPVINLHESLGNDVIYALILV